MGWEHGHCEFRAKIIRRECRLRPTEPGAWYYQYAQERAWLESYLGKLNASGCAVGNIEVREEVGS